MAKDEKTAGTEVRIVVRVDIPKTSSDVAIALHSKISELVKEIPNASVEVSILPPIEVR